MMYYTKYMYRAFRLVQVLKSSVVIKFSIEFRLLILGLIGIFMGYTESFAHKNDYKMQYAFVNLTDLKFSISVNDTQLIGFIPRGVVDVGNGKRTVQWNAIKGVLSGWAYFLRETEFNILIDGV